MVWRQRNIRGGSEAAKFCSRLMQALQLTTTAMISDEQEKEGSVEATSVKINVTGCEERTFSYPMD
jgi:hypothetical protein